MISNKYWYGDGWACCCCSAVLSEPQNQTSYTGGHWHQLHSVCFSSLVWRSIEATECECNSLCVRRHHPRLRLSSLSPLHSIATEDVSDEWSVVLLCSVFSERLPNWVRPAIAGASRRRPRILLWCVSSVSGTGRQQTPAVAAAAENSGCFYWRAAVEVPV